MNKDRIMGASFEDTSSVPCIRWIAPMFNNSGLAEEWIGGVYDSTVNL